MLNKSSFRIETAKYQDPNAQLIVGFAKEDKNLFQFESQELTSLAANALENIESKHLKCPLFVKLNMMNQYFYFHSSKSSKLQQDMKRSL